MATKKYVVQVKPSAEAPWSICDDCKLDSGSEAKADLEAAASEANSMSHRLGLGVHFRVIEAGATKTAGE